MGEQRDTCRDVLLPSGEVIRVRGRGGLGPAGVAALGELVDAVRALAAQNPPDAGAPELFVRIEAARGDRSLRECAGLAGVKFSVLFRVGQGRMPAPQDLELIEAWLRRAETCTPHAASGPDPAPETGGSHA